MKRIFKQLLWLVVMIIIFWQFYIFFNHINLQYKQQKEFTQLYQDLLGNNFTSQTYQMYPEVYTKDDDLFILALQALQVRNPQLCAWIQIDSTKINYPVMFTPNNPDFYKQKNFKKYDSTYGTPYLKEKCNIQTSDNLVIYANNPGNSHMFSALGEYYSQEFFMEHSQITLYTMQEKRMYQIINVAVLDFTFQAQIGQSFMAFHSAQDLQEKQQYLESITPFSHVFSDFVAQDTTKFITLITPQKNNPNHYIFVVGAQISP